LPISPGSINAQLVIEALQSISDCSASLSRLAEGWLSDGMADLASRIAEVRVTGLADQMRCATADAEDM
jgi:hypothetical protein